MRKLFAIFALVLGVFVARPAHAQEGTPTTVCDSTLMLLLFIAQHDYGFQSAVDVNTFDRGQFGPWFDAHSTATSGAAGTDAVPTAEAGDASVGTDATAETGDATPPLTVLVPGVVAGEAVECTALRAELENFFVSEINTMIGGQADG